MEREQKTSSTHDFLIISQTGEEQYSYLNGGL
jgi:hypothetical protein